MIKNLTVTEFRLTVTEFRALKLTLSAYEETEVFTAIKLCEEVEQFHPAHVMIEISEIEGKNYFEHPKVFLDIAYPLPEIEISYNEYGKLYSIFTRSDYKLPYITTLDISNARKAVNELNKIGKLNAKKIAAYIDAVRADYMTLVELSAKRHTEVELFKDSLSDLPVKWWRNDGKSGYIEKGGLQYEFSIENNGYISKKITVEAISTLDNFLKIADNKY